MRKSKLCHSTDMQPLLGLAVPFGVSCYCVVPKAPVNVTASPLSPTSIRVKWSPPQHHNALVERYGVQYWPLTLTEQHAREISTLDTMAFIDRLSPAAQYAVRVVAYQNTSRGVVSNAVNVTTQQQSK